jgi:hypothetical protein
VKALKIATGIWLSCIALAFGTLFIGQPGYIFNILYAVSTLVYVCWNMWRVHQRHCEWIAQQVYNRIKGEEFELNINKLPPIVMPSAAIAPKPRMSSADNQWARLMKMSDEEYRKWMEGAETWRQRKNSP